jgi:anti-anti-sigma regulatory factor
MIFFESGADHELWCTISDVKKLDETIIKEIRDNALDLLPGNERLYINLQEITNIGSSEITSLRRLMTDLMLKGCTVRFISSNEKLREILEYLTLSSDG